MLVYMCFKEPIKKFFKEERKQKSLDALGDKPHPLGTLRFPE